MKKRNLVWLVALGFVLACSSSDKKEPLKTNVFVEQKVADFVASHPKWTEGEKTDDEITDKFQHEVKRWSNETNFLDSMPLQLSSLRDTSLNNEVFKIGTFTAFNDNMRPKGSLLNYLQLRVDGFIGKEMESQLKLNGKYYIKGALYKQGSRKDVKVIHVSDFKGYDLGKYLFTIQEVKEIK